MCVCVCVIYSVTVHVYLRIGNTSSLCVHTQNDISISGPKTEENRNFRNSIVFSFSPSLIIEVPAKEGEKCDL